MPEISDLILTELRSLRDDLHSLRDDVVQFSRETCERLSSLETSMKSLIGDSQPGRIGEIEEEVKDLAAWRWRMLGICTGASGVISIVSWLIFRH